MKRTLYIAVFYFLIIPVSINAQSLSFKTYTVSDGLVANPVRCIYQDSKGFIWIGTYEGLSRYDGYKFKNYSTANGLSDNFINAIIEVNGKLLIGENNNAVDVIKDGKIEKRFLLTSAANAIMPFGNRVLISTDSSGFYEYKGNDIIKPSQEWSSTSLAHFVSYNDSFLICDGGDHNLIVFKKDLSIYSMMENLGLHFYFIFHDSKKRIWACTSRGLKLLQPTGKKTQPVLFSALPPSFDIEPLKHWHTTSMIEEQDGSFWIGTTKGLVHLFPDGSFYTYNEKDGLPSAMIYTLYLDRDNNLWIGTSLGLAKWVSRYNVVFYNTENNAFKNDVNFIYPDDDKKILLRTDHGLQYFYPYTKAFKNISSTENYFTPISGSPGLTHYKDNITQVDSSTGKIINIQKIDSVVDGVLFASMHSDGTIFLGGFAGLFAVKGSLVKKILPHRITSLTINSNADIWAGTWKNGLFRVRTKNNIPANYEIIDYTTLINHLHIRGLYADSKKNVWIGTRYNGAYCLTAKDNEKFEVQHFNRQAGLMSEWVNSFAETASGDMWVGTYLGIDKLVKEKQGFRVFNYSRKVNFFAEIKTILPFGDNEWICVGNKGIAHFKDDSIQQDPPLPVTILATSHGVLENKFTTILPTEKIYLRPNQNSARFEFSALAFINERQVLYSYRLKGSSDSSWSKPENIHEAYYTSLSPGNYIFEVRTIGWNGEPGKAAASIFTIATPFWKQGWFIALCVVLLASIIYALYRYRIKQIMQIQQVRNTIATDLHDDIGSVLTNIGILAQLSQNKNQQTAFAENIPARISEESTLAQQALDDIIWSVNSNNDNLDQTMARMRRYVAEVFEPIGINCTIDFARIDNEIKLNMEQRRDIYLVFKECLNNIIKHAVAKNVFIKISIERNVFCLSISDDGKGFDPLQQTHRNGLRNIRSRIQKWKGKVDIRSAAGEGTIADCSFPLASPK